MTYEYDTSGRLWKVTDPRNGLREYTYHPDNKLWKVTDARGKVCDTNHQMRGGLI